MVRVFLSSTVKELSNQREAIARAIERLDEVRCIRMEDFGARNQDVESFCREKIAECDILVGLIGHLHGSSPPGDARSYTEIEYDTAVALGKPRLMYMAAEDFPIPANLQESDD